MIAHPLSRSEISRLEEEVPRLAGRYRVFQQLRGYITDLVDCYDEKVGLAVYRYSYLDGFGCLKN